jgi:hypothetical protein
MGSEVTATLMLKRGKAEMNVGHHVSATLH